MAAIQRRFGRALRALREEAGVSQEALADLAGIHRTYVSMLERGIANPSLTVLDGLASALETPLSSIFLDVESRR